VKYGARNNILLTVRSIKLGDVMSLVKSDVSFPTEMDSVLTSESVEALELAICDKVQLVIKAVHVMTVKE